jgi:hypothetical protein
MHHHNQFFFFNLLRWSLVNISAQAGLKQQSSQLLRIRGVSPYPTFKSIFCFLVLTLLDIFKIIHLMHAHLTAWTFTHL